MKVNRWVGVAAILCSYALADQAAAQTLLQRLTEQFTPPPAQQPAQLPPPPGESLPAPQGALPPPGTSRPPLGIRVGPVTDDLIRDQQLIVRHGAVITAIEKGSAADRAGLPLGAVIVAVNGKVVNSPNDLVSSVQAARAGQDLELTYYDRNKLARKKVHLAAASGPEVVAIPNEPRRVLTPVPPSTPVPGQPTPLPGANLERDLGGDGARPLLGRLGRVIDNFAAPAQAVAPAQPAIPGTRPDLGSEVFELRQQLAELTKQVESLRKQVASLEQKMSAQRAP